MLSPIEPVRFGKYVLVARLTGGGMADLMLGVERAAWAAQRLVVIKRVRAESRADARYLECFASEARLSLCCAHPNLPTVYEMGAVDGEPYLALEYIRGATALELMRAARQARRALSVATVVSLGTGVAAALHYLHELRGLDGAPLGVIHRDVTPGNVMVSYDGAVKLIDLGVARNSLQGHQTAAGTLKGKFSYQAPEQLRAPQRIDHRVDLFLLGIVLHEALSGRALFRGEDHRDTLLRVLGAPIPDPCALRADVPRALGAVVMRALARDPAQRYATAGELLTDLERVAHQARVARTAGLLRDELVGRCGPPAPLAFDLGALAADEPSFDLDIEVEIDDVLEETPVHQATTLRGDRADPVLEAVVAWLDGWPPRPAAGLAAARPG